jgi:preprotein translocase subunit SecG
MIALVVVVHVLVCLFLILVILLQAGRGAGLSWGVLGGTPQSIFGTKSASLLTKATTISAILFLFTCIALNVIETAKSKSLFQSPQAQIDMDKIKQALSQIKEEDAGKTPPTSDAGAQNAVPSTPNVDVSVEAPAANASSGSPAP